MKIAIIGAGVAGLTAARELKKTGAAVTVFEKSRGLGGRLATRRTDWGRLDLGAQYFTARSEAFQQETRSWERAQSAALWPMTPYRVDGDTLQLSPDQQLRYVGVPDMNSISHFLAADIDVNRQTRITSLKRVKQRWTLRCESGELISGFDWVISSVPAEQAVILLENCSPLAGRLPTSVHFPCWALAMATVGEVDPAIQGIFGDDAVSWVSRLSSRPQRAAAGNYSDSWMLHFSPQWSRQHQHTDVADIGESGRTWLSRLVEVDLKPMHTACHYWRYASVTPGHTADDPPCYVDSDQQLAVIGAWCCGGRVEGAYLSATALIDRCFPTRAG